MEVVSVSAEHLLSALGRRGMAKPDFVIAGIPLGNLGGDEAGRLLDAIRLSRAEGGRCIRFQHSWLDRKKIQAGFPPSRAVPVFLNCPPAVVCYAQR